MVPRILIIAGSDSGGGAGIQADIKTVTMMGGHAMTAITALTAQNSLGVTKVMPVPADMVVEQIDVIASDIGVDAVKIGMIGSAEVAHAVADRLETMAGVPIVFDPVMIATSGAVLADDPTIAAFERLMAMASLTTPNAPELQRLAGCGGKAGARLLATRHGCAVFAKGGDVPGAEVTDILVSPDGEATAWTAPRIETRHSHGTGCTLASAVATALAAGDDLREALARARTYVRTALLAAPGLGAGHGPMGHWAADGGWLNLNQATVPASDYGASVGFYRTLGLRQIVDAPPRYARFECPGGATLSIHVEGEVQPGSALLYLETADLDALVDRLRGEGISFDTEVTEEPWLWREARLVDPAGNRLCLYQAGENRRFPPWRIGD